MSYAYRPQRVIQNEQDVRDELKRRTAKRGYAKRVAADTGVGVSVIYEARCGNRPMPLRLGEELGFTLAWVRMEELELLAKLESELIRPPYRRDSD